MKLIPLFGHFFKKLNKLGYIRLAVLLLITLTLMLLYLKSSEYESEYHTKDSREYCNAPSLTITGDEDENLDSYSLKQIQILIRHGDRAPIQLNALPNVGPVHISCSFNDSSGEELAILGKYKQLVDMNNIFTVTGRYTKTLLNNRYICQGGQLTPYGFLQHIFNGEHLKSRYQTFLSNLNIGTDIYVQTTNRSRTIQSAAALLAGIFHDDLIGNRLFLNVIKDYHDAHMLLDENGDILNCPALERNLKLVKSSVEFLTFKHNVEPVIEMFADILLVKRESMPEYSRFIDILFTKLCHSQGIPRGPGAKIPKSLVKQALSFAHLYTRASHSSVAEFQVLSLFSQIAMQSLNSILYEDQYKKLVIYSGHDSMITPFLQVLGMSDISWPPYASRVVIEFFRKDSQEKEISVKEKIKSTYFRIVYNGVVVNKIKFCLDSRLGNSYCSLSDLIKYVTDGEYKDHMDGIDPTTFRNILYKRIKNLCYL